MQRVVLLARAAWRVASRGGLGSLEPDAAPLLRAEHTQRLTLHVTAVSQRDYDLFFRHEIFRGQLTGLLVGNLRPAVVAVLFGQVVHLLLDQHPYLPVS